MLKGTRDGILKKVQPTSIHGQISWDVYFTEVEDPDGQVSVARVGPEAVMGTNLEPGDRIQVEYVVGVAVELVALRTLYERDHLDQVLATFGLILFFNELAAMIWGRAALYTTIPEYLSGHVDLLPGLRYPLYRLVIIAVGLCVAGLLWFVVARTRLGMLVRAGASNRAMVAALGVNVRLLYTMVFGFGAALAGLAGLMAGPIYAVQPGMGELILIQVFVVIVIGGIGSIRGALAGAIIVGVVDTMGRAFLKPLLGTILSPTAAESAGPALASMLIYLLMAVVLAVRPAGLFQPKN